MGRFLCRLAVLVALLAVVAPGACLPLQIALRHTFSAVAALLHSRCSDTLAPLTFNPAATLCILIR